MAVQKPVFLSILSILETYQKNLLVALFKKNRQFSVKPKHQNKTDGKEEAGIQSKWHELKQSRRPKSNILTSPWYMVLFLIVVLVLWYYLSGYD